MTSTRDYEHLLECANVIGVDYDERENRVTVFVSQKLPPEALSAEDDVERRLEGRDVALEVVDAGYGEERTGFDALSILEPVPEAAANRADRHRPVPAGVSEINAESTAATAGPYPARVEDPDAAEWRDDIEAGDLVRLANNHTYARSNEADFGEPILQPSPQDGGGPDDEVGELVGYVPVEDGVRVDTAARSVDPAEETVQVYELDPEWPAGVRREDYEELRGETVTKSGRTTGVTSATVEATGASARVNFGDEVGVVTFRDQLIAGPMSDGGDSGSAVFHGDTGELVGLLFAGSAEQTICNRIANVEADLGVELLVEEPDEGGDGDEGGGEDDESPVYVTTFDETVDVDFEGPALSLESVTVDGELTGDGVGVTVAVVASDDGTYWLEVAGERRTFAVDLDDSDPESGREAVDFGVETGAGEGSLEVRVRGGRVD